MIDIRAIPITTEEVVTRKILDEFILVPIHHTAKDVDSIYNLNDTASFIWERIDGKSSIAEIIESVINNFEVNEKNATEDVLSLINDLKHLGIVSC